MGIDSAESVEAAFKSECVFCSFVCTTYEKEYQPKLEVEEIVAPDMDALTTCLLSREVVDVDSDYDSEDDPVWNTQSTQVVNAMFSSVDSDDSDSDDESEMEEDSLSDIEEEEQIIERISRLF